MKKAMIDILTSILTKAGVTWFPKKKAEFLYSKDVLKVTRCEHCRHVREHDAPSGTVWYCPVHEHVVPSRGFCYEGDEKVR